MGMNSENNNDIQIEVNEDLYVGATPQQSGITLGLTH